MPLLNNDGLDDPLSFEILDSFTAGQVSLPRASSIPPNAAALLHNWVISATGELRKRRGAPNLGTGYVAVGGKRVQAMIYFNTVLVDRLIAVADGDAYYWTPGNPGTWTSYFQADVTNPEENISMVQLMDNIYWTDSSKTGIRKYNGTIVSTVAVSPIATILERAGTRLVASGVAAVPDGLYFSDLLDGDTWVTTSSIRIGAGDGDPIIALKTWQKSTLVILKRNSTHVLGCDPLLAASAWQLDTVHSNIGCVAKKSVAQVGQDVWFLAPGGVQSMQKQMATSNNEIATPVSYPIQNVIDTIRWEWAYKSCGIFYNNYYLLAVPITDEDPDTVLAYNTLTKGWTVFKGWSPTCFAEEPYGGRTRLVFGEPTGVVREWLDYTPPNEEDETSYRDWRGGIPLDFQIPAQIVTDVDVESRGLTRAMTFGEGLNQKAGFYLEAQFKERNGSCDLYAIRDNREPDNLGTALIEAPQIQISFTLPVTFPVSGWKARTFPLHYISDFRELQIELISSIGNCVIRNINCSAFIDTLDLTADPFIPVTVTTTFDTSTGFDDASIDFFTRAGITDTIQKTAVNDLVNHLKSSNLWTKMRVLYPFVGGTADSHSHNLKNSSFQISWAGTVTHNANGMTGDGSLSYSDTGFNLNTTTLGSVAFGIYNKTSASYSQEDIAATSPADSVYYSITPRLTADDSFYGLASSSTGINVPSITDARGFYILSRTSTILYKAFKDEGQIGLDATEVPVALPNVTFKFGSDHNLALAFVSDGLTDGECYQLNTAVAIFQAALGRSNPVVTYDTDATSFFSRAGITNVTQKSAVDNLVISLKSAGIWTKMRALYPFVGWTSTSHSHNLKDSNYQIAWNGMVTHGSYGVLGDGSTGVGNTGLNISTVTTLGSVAFGVYNRTSSASAAADISAMLTDDNNYHIYTRYAGDLFYGGAGVSFTFINPVNVDAKGFYIVSRQSQSSWKAFKNGTQFGSTRTEPAINPLPSVDFQLLKDSGNFSNHNLALAFISDGLSDAEMVSLSTAVETFETALGRNN